MSLYSHHTCIFTSYVYQNLIPKESYFAQKASLPDHLLYLYFVNFAESSVTIPALAPSQPNPPKVGSRVKNNLTLRWNAPPDNGAAITQYELEWDQCRGDWEQIYCDKAKQYKHNHRFMPGSHAQYRLKAYNEVGWR